MADTGPPPVTAEPARDAHPSASARDADLDDLVQLAAQVCDTPIALITVPDANHQRLRASVGWAARQTACDVPFGAGAMHGDDVMQVPDARLDPRFAVHPLVTGEPYIRFYAAAPLHSATGRTLGSLCVADQRPRLLLPSQMTALRTLARQVTVQLELKESLRALHEANERLAHAERVKDEFLSRITHELRTPLTSIHGYLEALEDDVPPQTAAKFMGIIRRNSSRLLRLVDDMLLAAQLSTGSITLHRRRIDLVQVAELAAEQHRPQAESSNLTLDLAVCGPLYVFADAQRLTHALDRLIFNAMKFTVSGGVAITTATRGGRPSIAVRDTGVGIPAEELDRLFMPFRRSRGAELAEVQGAGLGLSIVKALIEHHDGTITVDSALGAGTTVTITLPAA